VLLATSTNIYCERNGEQDIPVEESIRMCADAGYRYLDFGFEELNRRSTLLSKSEWKQELLIYKKIADDLGVGFVQAHAIIYNFCNISPNSLLLEKLMKRCVEGTALLGANWIVVHPSTYIEDGDISPETHARNVEYFKKLVNFAQQFDVGVAIENMWGKTKEGVQRYAIKAEELVGLIDAVDHPYFGACWDVEHGSVEGINQPDAIRMLGCRLKAVHISDESGLDHVHILPYMGSISWSPILQALAEINYNNPFTFEIQHYLPNVPEHLVLPSMHLSVKVGNYMIDQINAYKESLF